MKPWKLAWNTDEEEEDRWLDHTCATQFEDLISRLERAVQQVLETNSFVSISNHLLFKQTNSHPMGRDFSHQLDSRVSQHSVWFGLKHPFYFVLHCSALADGGEQVARTLLNCLTLAVANSGLTLPSLVVCESITLGFDPVSGQEMESTTVRLPGVKLDDAQRIFRQYTAKGQTLLPQISARLVWGVSFPQQTRQHLLQGMVCSAVFPLASEGGRLFENELFSTLTPEYCTEWQVQCIWNSKPESGPGFYQGDTFSLLTPLAIGLTKLKRLTQSNFAAAAAAAAKESAEMHDLARSIVDDAFATCSRTSSPFSRLSINLAHWLGTSSTSEEEEDCAKVQLSWEYFCRVLRTKFERKELLLLESEDDLSLQPDLSKGEVHQKVALVRFCQAQEYSAPTAMSNNNKPLGYTLIKTGKQAREPQVQPFSVWSSRREDDWMLTQEVLNSQLICDMQAFKFANTDSEFIDFLRWYSPKDVDSSDSVSDRMETGTWRQCWEESKPVPSHLQRPMFDCAVEGEKALHWLESISFPMLLRGICGEVKPPENEAMVNRAEAVRECEVIPCELRQALADNDGAVQVPARRGNAVTDFLLDLVSQQPADKREYLLYDGTFRLYLAASDTGDAVRVAKMM